MNIGELFEAWEQDSVFERDLITEESIKVPQLHSKWMKMLSTERMRLKSVQFQYKEMYRIKHEYYRGDLDIEDVQAYGWEPMHLKILRSDIQMYLDADSQLGEMQQKVDIAQEKIKFIEGVIQQINTRGFQIKNVIDWEKFKSGL